MKKIVLALVLISALFFTFFACGAEKNNIEAYEWKMRYIMHGEEKQLIVDAVAEEDAAHPEAKIIEMTLVAKDGKITITDLTNETSYEGTYTVDGKTPDGTNYLVIIDGVSGYATVAMTTYADGTEEPTLPINLGEYSLYFYSE